MSFARRAIPSTATTPPPPGPPPSAPRGRAGSRGRLLAQALARVRLLIVEISPLHHPLQLDGVAHLAGADPDLVAELDPALGMDGRDGHEHVAVRVGLGGPAPHGDDRPPRLDDPLDRAEQLLRDVAAGRRREQSVDDPAARARSARGTAAPPRPPWRALVPPRTPARAPSRADSSVRIRRLSLETAIVRTTNPKAASVRRQRTRTLDMPAYGATLVPGAPNLQPVELQELIRRVPARCPSLGR